MKNLTTLIVALCCACTVSTTFAGGKRAEWRTVATSATSMQCGFLLEQKPDAKGLKPPKGLEENEYRTILTMEGERHNGWLLKKMSNKFNIACQICGQHHGSINTGKRVYREPVETYSSRKMFKTGKNLGYYPQVNYEEDPFQPTVPMNRQNQGGYFIPSYTTQVQITGPDNERRYVFDTKKAQTFIPAGFHGFYDNSTLIINKPVENNNSFNTTKTNTETTTSETRVFVNLPPPPLPLRNNCGHRNRQGNVWCAGLQRWFINQEAWEEGNCGRCCRGR